MYDGFAIRRSSLRTLSITQTSWAESRPARAYQNWYVALAPTAEITARMWTSLRTCQACMPRLCRRSARGAARERR